MSSDTRLVVAGGGGGGAASESGCWGTNGGQAGDTTVTGAGNGGRGDTSCSGPGTPGGNGGFGPPGGTEGRPDAGIGDGYLGGGGIAQVGGMGGGAGGGYFGGGLGDNNFEAGGGGGAGSSYWVPTATATSMSEDASGTPAVTITPVLPAALCDPGSYSATGNAPCTPAPAGSYVAGTGNTAATPCPTGTFSDSLGASACTPASPGFYASGTGNASATQCAPGSYSTAAGASSCTPADKGSYAAGPGATSESPCPAGTFSAVTGSASCSPAPIGSYDAGTGNTSATPCPSGTTTTVVGATACVPIAQAPTFVLASPSLTATVGQVYGYTFLASGVPTPTYSLKTGAPSWLSIDPTGGTLTGTPPTGTKSFTYTVVASNGVTPDATATFTVTAAKASTQADLSVSLSSCPTTLKVGATGSCNITVHNSGPAPATSVVVGVALPSNLVRVSASAGGAWWFNIVSWKIGSLAPGASQSFTVTFKAQNTGTARIAAATVSFNPDPNWRNNVASAAVTLTKS